MNIIPDSEMKSSTENVKQLKGDGLKVDVGINDLNLRVSGDGCRVTVARNCGRIRVIGDGCSLKVKCNEGDIEYKGDGGSIYLGKGSRTESVSYVGDGGRISVRSEKSGDGEKRRVKKSGKNKCDNVDDVDVSRRSISDLELETNLQNAANEMKEAKEKVSSEKRKERNLNRSKTIVVTKIISEKIPVSSGNNNLIKNLFRKPPSVIRSFRSGPESF